MKDGLLDSFKDESISVYESCLQGKMIKLSFIGYEERTIEVLALVYIDVCDPFDVPVRWGYLYFITFTDDFSWHRSVFLKKHKFEVFERFKKFRCEIEKQTEKLLKILRSDQGGEYLSEIFSITLRKMTYSLNGLYLECLSSMEFQNGEIGSYWIWFDLWWASPTSLYFFRDMS